MCPSMGAAPLGELWRKPLLMTCCLQRGVIRFVSLRPTGWRVMDMGRLTSKPEAISCCPICLVPPVLPLVPHQRAIRKGLEQRWPQQTSRPLTCRRHVCRYRSEARLHQIPPQGAALARPARRQARSAAVALQPLTTIPKGVTRRTDAGVGTPGETYPCPLTGRLPSGPRNK